jgi:hypothetical protein
MKVCRKRQRDDADLLLFFLGLTPVPPPFSKINSTPADPCQGDASPIDDGGRVRTWFAGSAKEQPVAR